MLLSSAICTFYTEYIHTTEYLLKLFRCSTQLKCTTAVSYLGIEPATAVL